MTPIQHIGVQATGSLRRSEKGLDISTRCLRSLSLILFNVLLNTLILFNLSSCASFSLLYSDISSHQWSQRSLRPPHSDILVLRTEPRISWWRLSVWQCSSWYSGVSWRVPNRRMGYWRNGLSIFQLLKVYKSTALCIVLHPGLHISRRCGLSNWWWRGSGVFGDWNALWQPNAAVRYTTNWEQNSKSYHSLSGIGVVDSSGLEFFYTNTKATHEAGLLPIGHRVSPIMLIPPNTTEYEIVGFCSGECTKQVSVQPHIPVTSFVVWNITIPSLLVLPSWWHHSFWQYTTYS